MYRAALLRSMCGLSWNGLRRKPYVREVLAYRGNPFVRRRSERLDVMRIGHRGEPKAAVFPGDTTLCTMNIKNIRSLWNAGSM